MQRKPNGQSNEAEKRIRREGIAPEVGKHLSGFRVEEGTDISDAGGRLWKMEHEKSGATLFWLERDDEVKTFVIAFKTLPEDDKGAAHILEHAVLEGSENYPVKSPFDELRRSSMQVFMNAMTSPDTTYYPFATRIDADFLNLADVYLDAVFHPLVLSDPRRFRQEGWHYELDGATGKLSVNGVVFNEMKGQYASPDYLAIRETIRALHPDTVYANNPGGRPEAIPELTHEELCAFHRRFYHPSNALVFLDGQIPLAEILLKLDACFSACDRQPFAAEIPMQAPVDAKVRIPYESASCDRKVILSLGWSMGPTVEPPHQMLMANVLARYLCGSNEAPLKKALLAKGLCRDVFMFPSMGRQIPLLLLLKEVAEADLEDCRKTIRDVLEETCAQGFDRTRLDALIDSLEFSDREMNAQDMPKGLLHFVSAIRHWFYGGDPRAALSLSGIYGTLREDAAHGLFERLVREKLLGNRHRAEVVLVPDTGLARRRQDEWKARMARLKDGMTPEQAGAIADGVAELEAYQRRKDPPEAVARIPRLTSADLPPHGIPVQYETEVKNGVREIRVPSTASGIVYATLHFPMDSFSGDELLRMPLFARLAGKIGTSRRNAIALQTAVEETFGRLEFSAQTTARGRFFKVSLAVLPDRAAKAFGLLEEILLETRWSAVQAIETFLRQKQLDAEQDVLRNGCGIALRRARRAISERWMAADLLNGENQLRWLQGNTAGKALADWFAGVPERLFRHDGMIVSRTGNLPDGILDDFQEGLNGGNTLPGVRIEPVPGSARGFAIDGDTGFSAWVAELPEGEAATGEMVLAANVLSLEYLHHAVREIGGAYDVGMFVSTDGRVECWSFRDPDPAHSLEKMGRLGIELRRFAESGEDFDRYVVATIADMDPLRSSSEKAARAVNLFLDGRTPEDEERLRREILGTTREQLLEFADVLDRIAPTAKTCIVGGPGQLAGLAPEDIRPIIPSR